MTRRQCLLVTTTYLLLAACASPGGPPPEASMTMPLEGELQAITDVQGPYGAVSYGAHAVAVRLWPDTLGDGLAEITVIVTNGGWNTVVLDVDNIALVNDGIESPVLGRSLMLARSDATSEETSTNQGGDLDPPGDSVWTRESSGLQSGTTGSRQNSEIGSTSVDSALASAARRGTANRRPAPLQMNAASLQEQREVISDWYLQLVEIYPGDTGTGGISIPVPGASADLELHVRIGEEDYMFPISYRTY